MAGGTFESDTGGTFQTATDGTFVSATAGTFESDTGGTFESDMGGTFTPLLSEISTVINHELIQLLLSYGSGVTVLKPQKLVTAIKEELSLSLQKYQSVQINCTDSV
jgi:hypothetical protein